MTNGRRPEADDSPGGTDLPAELIRRLGSLREQIRANHTHYELLGVARNADRKTIKRAYYELAALVHPDRHGGRELGDWKPLMEALFRHVTLAHDTLGDATLRRHYDETLPPAPELPPAPPPPPPPSARRVDVESGHGPSSTRTPYRVPTPVSVPPPLSARVPTRVPTPVSVRVPVGPPPAAPRPAAPAEVAAPVSVRAPLTAPTPVSAHWPTQAQRIPTPPASSPSAEANRRDALARRLLAGRTSTRRQETVAAVPDAPASAPMVDEKSSSEALRTAAEAAEFRGEYTSAVKSWRQLRVLDPKNPELAHRAAKAILGSKDANLHEAAELAKKAILESPRDYKNHLLLAEIYLEAQLPSAARSVIEHALGLGDGAKELTALLARVESRRK